MNEKQKPDGNAHCMPLEREHIESEDCWCQPELTEDFTNEGGTKLYVHKEIQ